LTRGATRAPPALDEQRGKLIALVQKVSAERLHERFEPLDSSYCKLLEHVRTSWNKTGETRYFDLYESRASRRRGQSGGTGGASNRINGPMRSSRSHFALTVGHRRRYIRLWRKTARVQSQTCGITLDGV
jgi:hypothetical protein